MYPPRVPQRNQPSLAPYRCGIGGRTADRWRGLRPYWSDAAPLEPPRAPVAVTRLELGPIDRSRHHRQGKNLLGFRARGDHSGERLAQMGDQDQAIDAAVTERHVPLSPSPQRVLVIDDEPAVAALIRDALEGDGYEVLCRATPPSPSEVAALAPDVIVTELVFHAKQDGHVAQWDPDAVLGSSVPVIVCSVAVDRLATIADDLAAHGHLALAKPFNLDDLTRLVASRCGGPSRQDGPPLTQ